MTVRYYSSAQENPIDSVTQLPAGGGYQAAEQDVVTCDGPASQRGIACKKSTERIWYRKDSK